MDHPAPLDGDDMYDLFRFLVLRTAEPASDLPVVPLDAATRLREQLRGALAGDRPREAVREAAAGYAASQHVVRSTSELALQPALGRFVAMLGGADLNAATVVRQIFDRSAEAVVATDDYASDWRRVVDTLVAAKLAPAQVADGLADVARALYLLRRLADGQDPGPGLGTALLVLPADVVPLPPAPARAPDPTPADPVDDSRLADDALQLRSAVLLLRDVSTPAPPPAEVPEIRRTSDAQQARLEASVRTDLAAPRPSAVRPDPAPGWLTDAALAPLPPRALHVLTPHADLTVDGAQTLLKQEFVRVVSQIDPRYIARLLPDLHFEPVVVPGPHDEATDPPPATMTAVPATHGSISPAGVADLLVTRHHTLRYEPGEVAHVENVARGEALTRETRRLDSSETTTVVTTDITVEDERDQQSTGRFELTREAGDVVKSDQARVPGQPSSESYGSLVETGRSREASTKEAETYGRGVTSRAASRITSRTTSSVTQQVLRQLEEKATHGFAASDDAASHVYQWLDRVVQAQVFSYGKRLMYDVVVPEPAAFLAHALQAQPDAPLPPRPAPFTLQPTWLNDWNWPYYVAGYGATGVTPPPPETVTVVRTFASLAQNVWSSSVELRSTLLAQGTTIEVPDGYRATSATAVLTWGGWEGAEQHLDLTIGRRWLGFDWGGQQRQTTKLDGETGQLALAARLDGGIYSVTVAIQITCALTDERLSRWQVSAHAALLAAAQQRLEDYEGRLARVKAGVRLLSAGQTPERKRERERDELHKACLAVISNQQFDGLSAVEHSPQGYPQPYLPNVETYGTYLRFLENAFEWEQMTWRYSPYFWGRKPLWVDVVLRDDADPAFADFLRAGAARVLVPVRPGDEAAVTDFMQTGVVPAGTDLQDVTSPLYVPLLQELREPDTALDGGTAYSRPWELRLPTTLVALRSTPTLPRWTPQTAADGTTTWDPAAGDALP